MDAITGALLIGTWASSLLYTAEIYQAMYYYRHFKNDNWRLKALVSVAFLIDTVALLNDYACVYLYTITHVGDTAYFANQNWTIPVYVFTTAAVALPVQIYLVARYWKFSAHKHVITLLLGLLILAAFGGSFTCGLMVAVFPALKDRNKLKNPAILWLITEAAADIGIAVALLWEFLKTRPTSIETKSVVKRLIAVTLQTGTATAAIAVAALIGYLLNEESNIGVGFAWCLGRTYVLSMVRPFTFASVLVLLSNLNVRNSARVWTPSTSKAATSTIRSTSVAFAQPGTEMDTNLSGLYSHHTAVVHIEGHQDMNPQSLMTKKSMHDPEHTTDIEMAHLSCKKEQEESF
ncbi:hypothetical protein DFH08DRAFT_1039073 [Mycena albidolilacea]|uniref:DUF6534 domain-containing protein n=1 Tax=Mycena albidolilacea TaxID=1033008 RepID=A0AAD7EZI2_9AGAR|nr:hypothetical protein DFH08DRAFT_1039073 [Mycena albidolilacea]